REVTANCAAPAHAGLQMAEEEQLVGDRAASIQRLTARTDELSYTHEAKRIDNKASAPGNEWPHSQVMSPQPLGMSPPMLRLDVQTWAYLQPRVGNAAVSRLVQRPPRVATGPILARQNEPSPAPNSQSPADQGGSTGTGEQQSRERVYEFVWQ